MLPGSPISASSKHTCFTAVHLGKTMKNPGKWFRVLFHENYLVMVIACSDNSSTCVLL